MKKDLKGHLFGPSSFFMWDNHAKKQQFPFFQSFQSVADFGSRTASIITAPILSATISCAVALLAVWELSKALGNLLFKFDTKSAGENLKEAGANALLTLICLLAIVISPIANTVSLVGSGVNTVKEATSSSHDKSMMDLETQYESDMMSY